MAFWAAFEVTFPLKRTLARESVEVVVNEAVSPNTVVPEILAAILSLSQSRTFDMDILPFKVTLLRFAPPDTLYTEPAAISMLPPQIKNPDVTLASEERITFQFP